MRISAKNVLLALSLGIFPFAISYGGLPFTGDEPKATGDSMRLGLNDTGDGSWSYASGFDDTAPTNVRGNWQLTETLVSVPRMQEISQQLDSYDTQHLLENIAARPFAKQVLEYTQAIKRGSANYKPGVIEPLETKALVILTQIPKTVFDQHPDFARFIIANRLAGTDAVTHMLGEPNVALSANSFSPLVGSWDEVKGHLNLDASGKMIGQKYDASTKELVEDRAADGYSGDPDQNLANINERLKVLSRLSPTFVINVNHLSSVPLVVANFILDGIANNTILATPKGPGSIEITRNSSKATPETIMNSNLIFAGILMQISPSSYNHLTKEQLQTLLKAAKRLNAFFKEEATKTGNPKAEKAGEEMENIEKQSARGSGLGAPEGADVTSDTITITNPTDAVFSPANFQRVLKAILAGNIAVKKVNNQMQIDLSKAADGKLNDFLLPITTLVIHNTEGNRLGAFDKPTRESIKEVASSLQDRLTAKVFTQDPQFTDTLTAFAQQMGDLKQRVVDSFNPGITLEGPTPRALTIDELRYAGRGISHNVLSAMQTPYGWHLVHQTGGLKSNIQSLLLISEIYPDAVSANLDKMSPEMVAEAKDALTMLAGTLAKEVTEPGADGSNDRNVKLALNKIQALQKTLESP